MCEQLNKYKPDVLLLQEICMYKSELHELNNIATYYKESGVSGLCQRESITQGRKYEGVTCLWNTL